MSPDAVVPHPRSVSLSRAGEALWWLAFPWLFGVAVVSRLVLFEYMEPVAPRILVVVVAVAPLVLYFGSPVLGRLPGLRWLLATPQPLASLDEDEIQLDLPDIGVRRFAWREIDHLELHRTWRRRWGELRALDGSLLAIVPDNLVYLRETWRVVPTLAEAVVRMRPDLFVLTAADWGRPDAFGRPGPEVVPVDVAAVARAHARLVRGVIVSLAIIGVVLVLVQVLRPA
jgi:hypothetical protein